MFNTYCEIEECHQTLQPSDEFSKAPGFCEMFLYCDSRKNCYRAYRLPKISANKPPIRAFLIDIGVEIYQYFQPGMFLKMPVEFSLQKIPPMALFCSIDEIPSSFGSVMKSEFLKASVASTFKFEVHSRQRQTRKDLGENVSCLHLQLVAVEGDQSNEEAISSDKSQDVTVIEVFPALTYLDGNSSKHVPFTADRMASKRNLPLPGSRILIFKPHIVTSTSVYASFVDSPVKTETYSDFVQLRLMMNNKKVAESYRKIYKPMVGELVVVADDRKKWHRGLVVKVLKKSYKVSYNNLPN